jgi:heptosyltransferase-2
MKILVIQKKRIGDVLTSTILLEALKAQFPDAKLHYLIYENSLAVVQNNPFVDKIVVLNEKTRKELKLFIPFLFEIRKENYDVIVDAYGKPNSVLIGWFSGAKKRITFDKVYSRLLYTDAMVRKEAIHPEATTAIEHRMLLLEPLNIPFRIITPKIFLLDQEIDAAKNRLTKAGIDLSKKLVMISALGSSDSKTYPLEQMAKVLDQIAEEENTVLVLNYLPWQKEQAQELYRFCNPATQAKIAFDFYENDLREFLATTALCNALIGNEGGATNMAKALQIPTFTIFCPGVPKIGWNLSENDTTNISVHSDDYGIEGETVEAKYKLFTPHLFHERLQHFLNHNLKENVSI